MFLKRTNTEDLRRWAGEIENNEQILKVLQQRDVYEKQSRQKQPATRKLAERG